LIRPLNPLPVQPGRTETMPLFVLLPRSAFEEGVRTVNVRVTDGARFAGEFPYRLAGPMHDDENEAHDKPGRHE